MTLSYDLIQHALTGNTASPLPDDAHTRAAVALILRAVPSGMEILFIERAAHPEDPWSGNLGFPGGKVESEDGSERRAAERETGEEIGLELGEAEYLGRIPDIIGAHLPVRISCFVYGLVRPARLVLEDEVRSVFWFPLDQLQSPDRHMAAIVNFTGREMTAPAIRIMAPGQTVLWGITYRLVLTFLEILANSGLMPPIALPTEK